MLTSLIQRIRDLWLKLIHLKSSPEQIAGGFSIGIFASLLPILPFDTPLAMGLAWLSRRNVMAAVTATSSTLVVVPVIPFIWLAEYHLGKLIVPAKQVVQLSHANLGEVLRLGRDVFAATFVGSMMIAPPIALISYFVIKQMVIKWRFKHGQARN